MTKGAYTHYLESNNPDTNELASELIEWADINTGSLNLHGLGVFAAVIENRFLELGAEVETIPLPPQTRLRLDGPTSLPLGNAILVKVRQNAPIRVMLTIHYDTVYDADNSFQKCVRVDSNTINGPGVADAKGGLLVLLKALELFEKSPWSNLLGWDAIITPDEEIGSTGSRLLLLDRAKRNDVALVFEPALPDGALVGSRSGSSVYSAQIMGRPAHAGREPERGRNAIHAMAGFIVDMMKRFENWPGINLNVGEIMGIGPVNIVRDLAYTRFNVRTKSDDDYRFLLETLNSLCSDLNARDGFSIDIEGEYSRPPKVMDSRSAHFFEHIANCGHEIGVEIKWGHSRGASDGNIIAQAGIPVLDGLGVRGGALHTPDEFVDIRSIKERIRLTALFLIKLACGDIRRN